MSVSHPDLAQSLHPAATHAHAHSQDTHHKRLALAQAEERWRESQRKDTSQSPGSSVRDSVEVEARVGRRMLGLLAEENKALRAQVAAAAPKTAKLAQLEVQYQTIEKEYAELVRRQERREELEVEMRERLDAQLRSLSDNNRRLQHQLDLALLKLQSMADLDHADEAQLRNFQAAIGELRADNATLGGIKERQELELEAQRATLEEQRTHIHILDKALQNAQDKALRLDEELKRKTQLAERAELLEKALQSARAEIQKRDEQHRRREAQLQMDIAGLQLAKPRGSRGGDGELVRRLGEELESREQQIRVLKDQLATAHKHQLDPEESSSRPRSKNDDPPAWDDHLSSRLSHLESRLSKQEEEIKEKDGIIRALVASANRSPDFLHTKSHASFNTLELTRQRLESARRRILESPSSSGAGLGSRFNRLFSPKHGREFSSASLDRHHHTRILRSDAESLPDGHRFSAKEAPKSVPDEARKEEEKSWDV